jgi:hypothetical protein
VIAPADWLGLLAFSDANCASLLALSATPVRHNRPGQGVDSRYACGLLCSSTRPIARRALQGTKRMKGIHPSVNRGAICALMAASFAVGGCRSTSSGVANPFLAPDRVAPPSTRVIAPGQAQPYYQGDPLPVMQSATPPPPANVLASNGSAEARSSTGKTLAWNSPGGPRPAAATAASVSNAGALSAVAPPAATPITYGNEPAVVVPMDSDSLRFAMPAPFNAEPAAPIAAAPTIVPGALATMAPSQGIVLATYNAPIPKEATPVGNVPTINPAPQVTSPWRSPQISQASPPPMYGAPASRAQPAAAPFGYVPVPVANPYAQTPVAAAPHMMAVQLRSVPSPPQPGSAMPRIRIPGYQAPQVATADGFRPRSSMR